MLKPTRKPNYALTFHKDGTVSHWDAIHQAWRRRRPEDIPPEVLVEEWGC